MMRTATDATRPVDLKRIEDEIDAIFCAHLAWLWVTAPEQLTVVGDFDGGYIVTPPAPDSPVDHAVSVDRGVLPV